MTIRQSVVHVPMMIVYYKVYKSRPSIAIGPCPNDCHLLKKPSVKFVDFTVPLTHSFTSYSACAYSVIYSICGVLVSVSDRTGTVMSSNLFLHCIHNNIIVQIRGYLRYM